jgi:hypothetical protein
MPAITSVNAIFTLSISNLFPAPVQLQGFSAEDIFTNDPVVPNEISMGLDGVLSAGYVNVPTPMSIMLQADSASNDIFDQWRYAPIANNGTVYFAQGTLILPALAKKWAMTQGVLTSFPTVSDAARTLRPRRFGITWESVTPAPI